ncbi:oxidoreductase domain protein [Methylorubrum extorquens CM4]|uniref:Oxidoreductase domain protein n=2 Tax=Methylorubrum extorquens TaxID=408 RepID=B7KYP2_METC4|nr:oxidoreductase domain protein [Methylorubrum extorquens CM4]
MAANHARALQAVPSLDLTTSVSRDPTKASVFAAEHGIGRSVGLDAFMGDPGVDGLYVVVPAASMLEVATRLSGLHLPLMLEKPVGLDPDETRDAVARVDAPHMVGLNRRSYEIVQRAKRWIDDHGGPTGIEIQMPEDIRALSARYPAHVLNRWMFGNSVHLIDLFRFFCGEPETVEVLRRRRDFADWSVAASLSFVPGAVGVFHAHWGAPGGWRVAVSARDTQIVLQPVEKAMMLRRGSPAEEWTAIGPDREFKAGLFRQAEVFANLVSDGRLPPGAADLRDYARSVDLVGRLFGYGSEACFQKAVV